MAQPRFLSELDNLVCHSHAVTLNLCRSALVPSFYQGWVYNVNPGV